MIINFLTSFGPAFAGILAVALSIVLLFILLTKFLDKREDTQTKNQLYMQLQASHELVRAQQRRLSTYEDSNRRTSQQPAKEKVTRTEIKKSKKRAKKHTMVGAVKI